MDYKNIFKTCREPQLYGRYITLGHIEPLLRQQQIGSLEVIGMSVQQNPIYALTVGTGATRILMWSQMHGNESTATKALFDLIRFLRCDDVVAQKIFENCTLCIIPMLNPDGAALYTRENAAGTDLNRDFSSYSQPESRCLKAIFDDFTPNYCYNLHDQRTIFGVGDTGKPATISFLAPSFDENRHWNEHRTDAATVIIAMNRVLQQFIPGQVGRFDDAFNNNCAGDTFQMKGVPTILIEAGHFQHDYEREVTREYFFTSMLAGLIANCENVVVTSGIAEYLNIPQNKAVFYDFVYKNVKINDDGKEIITNFAAQFKETLIGDKVAFEAVIIAVGNLERLGHFEYDANQAPYSDVSGSDPKIDSRADFYIGNQKFLNGAPVG